MLILWMFSQPFLLLPLWTRSVLNSRLLPRRSENYSQSIQTSSSPIDFVKYTIFKIWGHMKRELYEKYTFTKFKITTFSWNTLPDFEICKFIVLLNSFDTCLPILNIVFFLSHDSLPSVDLCLPFLKFVNIYFSSQCLSYLLFKYFARFWNLKKLNFYLTDSLPSFDTCLPILILYLFYLTDSLPSVDLRLPFLKFCKNNFFSFFWNNSHGFKNEKN